MPQQQEISPDKDLNGSGEYLKLRTQLKKALADSDTMDDDQLKSAIITTMRNCEKMIDDGGTVDDVLNNLREKIAQAQSLKNDVANIDRPAPEAPPAKVESPKTDDKKLKGGTGKKGKGLGDINAADFLKAHPEFASSGEEPPTKSELDIDPDHADDGKKRRRKKKLAEGNRFDSIIDRFKQRLMESQVHQSKLSASQKLIFS